MAHFRSNKTLTFTAGVSDVLDIGQHAQNVLLRLDIDTDGAAIEVYGNFENSIPATPLSYLWSSGAYDTTGISAAAPEIIEVNPNGETLPRYLWFKSVLSTATRTVQTGDDAETFEVQYSGEDGL